MALRLAAVALFISTALSSRLEGQHRHKKDGAGRKIASKPIEGTALNLQEVEAPLLEQLSSDDWHRMHRGKARWNEVEARTLRPLVQGFDASAAALLEVDREESGEVKASDKVGGNASNENASEWFDPVVSSSPSYASRDCLEKVYGARGSFEGCRCKEGEEVFCGEKSIWQNHTFTLSEVLRACPDRTPTCSKAEPKCAQIAGAMLPNEVKTCNCPTGLKVFCGGVELHEGQSIPLAETLQKCQWNPYCAVTPTCATAVHGGAKWPSGEYPTCQCQDPMFELTCGDSTKDTGAHVFKLELETVENKISKVSLGGEACPYPKCVPSRMLKTKTNVSGVQDDSYVLTPPTSLPSTKTSKHVCTQIEFNMRTLGIPVLFKMGLQGSVSQDKKLKCYGLDMEVQLQISAGLHNNLRLYGVVNALLNVSEIPLAATAGELEFKNDFDYEEKLCHSDSPWTILRKSADDIFKFWWNDVMWNKNFDNNALTIHAKERGDHLLHFEQYQKLLAPTDAADVEFQSSKPDDVDETDVVKPTVKRSRAWLEIKIDLDERKEQLPLITMDVTVMFKEKLWDICEKFTKAEVVIWQEVGQEEAEGKAVHIYKEEFSEQENTVLGIDKPKLEVVFDDLNINKHKDLAMEVRMYRDGTPVCVAPAVLVAKPEITSTGFWKSFLSGVYLGVDVLRYKAEGEDKFSLDPTKEQTLSVTKLTAKTANEGTCDRKLMSLELAVNTGQRNGQQRAFWNPSTLGHIAPWGVQIDDDPTTGELPSDALKALIEKTEGTSAAEAPKSPSFILNLQHQTPEQLSSLLELGKTKGTWSNYAGEVEQWYAGELDHITVNGTDRARREVLASFVREVLHKTREELRSNKAITTENADTNKASTLETLFDLVAQRASVEAIGCAEWATQFRPSDSPDDVAKKLKKCYDEAVAAESKEPASLSPAVDESERQHEKGPSAGDPGVLKEEQEKEEREKEEREKVEREKEEAEKEKEQKEEEREEEFEKEREEEAEREKAELEKEKEEKEKAEREKKEKEKEQEAHEKELQQQQQSDEAGKEKEKQEAIQKIEENQQREQNNEENVREEHAQQLKKTEGTDALLQKQHKQGSSQKQKVATTASSSNKHSSNTNNSDKHKKSRTSALLETDLEMSKRPTPRGSLGKQGTLDPEEQLYVLDRTPHRDREFFVQIDKRQANPGSCSLVHHDKEIYPRVSDRADCKGKCEDLQKVVPKVKLDGEGVQDKMPEVEDLDNRNFTNLVQFLSDGEGYLCQCFHCTDFTDLIMTEQDMSVMILGEFQHDVNPTPREIVSVITEVELEAIMMGFDETDLEAFVAGLSATSVGPEVWSRMVKDRLLVDKKLRFGAIDWSATAAIFGRLFAEGHDFITPANLEHSMNLRPVAPQVNQADSAELVVRTEVKGDTWEIHRQELANMLKFNYLKDVDLSKPHGTHWTSKLVVEFKTGGANEDCNVEVEIDFKLQKHAAQPLVKAPNLVEPAQAIFSAYDMFKGKLPEFANTAASFLEMDPVDPDRDMSDHNYQYANGRFLHRDFQYHEKDELKTFVRDMGKDDTVYNYARARSLSKYKDEKSFLFNTALSLANFFIRILQDVQAMWNIYFARDPFWDGQCSSLPTTFAQYKEMFATTVADRATNWGKNQTMHVNHVNFAGVGQQGPHEESFWKASFPRTTPRFMEHEKIWLTYPWIHKAKSGLSPAEAASFFDESPPVHGKDGWATIDPTQLSGQMWPHLWCELAGQYFTQDTHHLTAVRRDALWTVMSGLRTLRSTPPQKGGQTELPKVKISYTASVKEEAATVQPQQRIAAGPQDFVEQALIPSLNKSIDSIRQELTKMDSKTVQCTDTRSESLQTFYREMTLFSVAFGILEDIQAIGHDVVLRGRMIIDSYIAKTKPFKIPKGLKVTKEAKEELAEEEDTEEQAALQFVDTLDQTLYTLRDGLAQTKAASEKQLAAATAVHDAFIATMKLRGSENIIEPTKLDAYAMQRADLETAQAKYQVSHHQLKVAIEGVVSLSQRVANWYPQLSTDVFNVKESDFTGLKVNEDTFQAAIAAASQKVQYAATMLNAFVVVGDYVSAQQRSIHTCFDEMLHHEAPDKASFEPVVEKDFANRQKLMKDLSGAMDMAEVDENKVDGLEFFFEEHCMIPVNYGFEKTVTAPPTETRPECESAIISKALMAVLPSFASRSVKTYKKLYRHLNDVMRSLKEENSKEAASKNLDEMTATLAAFLEDFDDGMDNDIYTAFAYRHDGSMLGELWAALPDAEVKLAMTREVRQKVALGQAVGAFDGKTYVNWLLSTQRQTNKAYPRVLTRPERKDEPCLCSKSWDKRVWFGNTLRQRGYQGCDIREFWTKDMWKDDPRTCTPAHWLDGETECPQEYLRDCMRKPNDGELPWFRVWYTTGISMKPVVFPIMSSTVTMHLKREPFADFCRDSRPHKNDDSWAWMLDSWIPWKLHRTHCKSWSVAPPAIKLSMDICRFFGDETTDEEATNKTVEAHYTEFKLYSEYHLESWEASYPKLSKTPDPVERDLEVALNLASCPGFDAEPSSEPKEGCTLNVKDQFASRTNRFSTATALIMDKLVSGNMLKVAKPGDPKKALAVIGEEVWDIMVKHDIVAWSDAVDVTSKSLKKEVGSDLSTMDFTVTDRNSTMVFSASKSFRPEMRPWPTVVQQMSAAQIARTVGFIAPKLPALSEAWKERKYKHRSARFDAMSEEALRKGLMKALEALKPSENLAKVEQLLETAGKCNARCFAYKADPSRGLSDAEEVLGYSRKDLGSWMRVGYGDVLFGAGKKVWLTQHSDTWFYQLTHSGDESGAYFPAFYEGHELLPDEDCKKTPDLPHDLFAAADYTCLQTLAKKLDVEQAKEAWDLFIKENCGEPPVEGLHEGEHGETAALPPGCASGEELSRMLLQSVQTSKARKILVEAMNRGEHSAASFEEESGLEQANTRPWSFQSTFHSETPVGESVKVESAIVDFPFAWQKRLEFDFMPVIESLRARMPVGSVKDALTVLQAHKERVEECKRCLKEPEPHGFCDWGRAEKAMLGEDYRIEKSESPCMTRAAASRYKCEHFAVKSYKTGLVTTLFPFVKGTGDPSPPFAEEKCPCIGSGGQSVTPEWITTEEQCEELLLPDEYFQQTNKELKEEELASETRVARLALDVKLEPADPKYGCQNGYMCCETLTVPLDGGTGVQDHLACIHEKSISGFLSGANCKSFKATTPGLQSAEWSSVADPIRCMDQESIYSHHMGYWRQMGEHWIQNDRVLTEEEAERRQKAAEEEAARVKFEEIHRGCPDEYFCCKETGEAVGEAPKKGCFLEDDLGSFLSSGECSKFKAQGPLEEMKVEALATSERCEPEQKDQFSGYWRKAGDHWVQSAEPLSEKDAEAKKDEAKQTVDAYNHEKLHQGCAGDYFCCEKVEGGEKACYDEGSLKSGMHIAGAKCEDIKDYADKLQAVEPKGRCAQDAGYWKDVSGALAWSKDWKKFATYEEATKA